MKCSAHHLAELHSRSVCRSNSIYKTNNGSFLTSSWIERIQLLVWMLQVNNEGQCLDNGLLISIIKTSGPGQFWRSLRQVSIDDERHRVSCIVEPAPSLANNSVASILLFWYLPVLWTLLAFVMTRYNIHSGRDIFRGPLSKVGTHLFFLRLS